MRYQPVPNFDLYIFILYFYFFIELYSIFPNFLRFFIFSCFSHLKKIEIQPIPFARQKESENYSIAMVTPVRKKGNQVNMAATTSQKNSSRYPSEKSVKEALDMLKPPGILSKVGFTIFCDTIEHYCHFTQRILSIRILQIIPVSFESFFFFSGLQPVSAQTIPGMFSSILCT